MIREVRISPFPQTFKYCTVACVIPTAGIVKLNIYTIFECVHPTARARKYIPHTIIVMCIAEYVYTYTISY